MRFSPAPGGAAFLDLPGLARFLVRQGREILIDPQAGADPSLIRGILYGWIVAMICLQRDSLVLHASAVTFGERVTGFLGDQSAGKSTLAAHCIRAGARLVADDLLRIEVRHVRSPKAYPGMPLLKLRDDCLRELGHEASRLAPAWGRSDKFLAPISDAHPGSPLPLARLYVLVYEEGAGPGSFERLSGSAAVTALVNNSHGNKSLDVVGRRQGHFRDCARLVEGVEIVRLARRRCSADLPRTVAMIIENFRR
jgi:hypothetical protein